MEGIREATQKVHHPHQDLHHQGPDQEGPTPEGHGKGPQGQGAGHPEGHEIGCLEGHVQETDHLEDQGTGPQGGQEIDHREDQEMIGHPEGQGIGHLGGDVTGQVPEATVADIPDHVPDPDTEEITGILTDQ